MTVEPPGLGTKPKHKDMNECDVILIAFGYGYTTARFVLLLRLCICYATPSKI